MPFDDNLSSIWGRFFDRRTKQLWDRLPGLYRAVVVETNDPLNLYRVRFKCPELHDHDLKPEECPWAVPMPDLGGKRAGRWSHPMIKDWIWISFEKGHPYGPIWTGFANPTRRKLYTYPQIFQKSPLSVNDKGDPADTPQDYDEDYLPKDGRPMSHGWQDRYGSMDISRSIGFFPEEHKKAPPDPDYDAIAETEFKQKKDPPKKNEPDAKYMARITKYGHLQILGDQGYKWDKEFKGSFADDEEFEIKRWKYLQKFLNEGESKDTDQRRFAQWTRYGHLWEMRDVGWSKTRKGEYTDEEFEIGTKTDVDYRWIKLRTKGGFLFQAYDKGFDSEKDTRVKRLLKDETGTKGEHEKEWWADKDARWMRFSARHGYKIVIDQRGTHSKESDKRTLPRGNGILIKGRRPGSSQGHHLPELEPGVDGIQVGGDITNPEGTSSASGLIVAKNAPLQRGFAWEFNENDEANWTAWSTPLGQTIFLNDKIQNIVMCTRIDDYTKPFMGLQENEFQTDSPTSKGCETGSYHLKLDLDNEYLRLKTRGAKGAKPFVPPSDGCHTPSPRTINESGLDEEKDINQGFEAHDGKNGDGPWVEVVDAKNRGLWFSYKLNLTVLHARNDEEKPKRISLSFDDEKNEVLLRNDEAKARLQIRCNGDIDIIANSGNINLIADKNINMLAKTICMNGGGSTLSVNQNNVGTNTAIHATVGRMRFPGVEPGPGAGRPSPVMCTFNTPTSLRVEQMSPTDRAKHYNDDFDTSVPIENIEHPVSFKDPCADDGRSDEEEE